MNGRIDLHAAAALHFRLLAPFDTSGQAELLALVHGVLAGEADGEDTAPEREPAGIGVAEPLYCCTTPCRS